MVSISRLEKPSHNEVNELASAPSNRLSSAPMHANLTTEVFIGEITVQYLGGNSETRAAVLSLELDQIGLGPTAPAFPRCRAATSPFWPDRRVLRCSGVSKASWSVSAATRDQVSCCIFFKLFNSSFLYSNIRYAFATLYNHIFFCFIPLS